MQTWGLVRYLAATGRHFILITLVIFVMLSALLGGVGQSLGVQRLFYDAANPFLPAANANIVSRLLGSALFSTQLYAVSLLALVWTLVVLVEIAKDTRDDSKPAAKRDAVVLTITWPLILTSLLPLAAVLWTVNAMVARGFVDPHAARLAGAGWIVGIVLTLAFTWASLAIADGIKASRAWTIIVLSAFLLMALTYIPLVLPAKAIFIALAWIVLAWTAIFLVPSANRVFIPAVAFGVFVATNLMSEKYRFPGMEDLYDNRVKHVGVKPTQRQAVVSDQQCSATAKENSLSSATTATAAMSAIDPIHALQAWYSRVAPTQRGRPKLVAIAASGGGYRATFWTGLVLDKLLTSPSPGLANMSESVRLLTGASGGMVAQAYLSIRYGAGSVEESLVDQIEADLRRIQFKPDHGYTNPIASPRDSLSAIVRQLIMFDMPGVVWPARRNHDRGRELESHWASLDAKTFSDLLPMERMGLSPHLIVSPGLSNTGEPLLITNLAASTLVSEGQDASDFFGLFGDDLRGKFRLSTAIRMNATFPYASPAVQLPLTPQRRVIDAAYHDNYGVSMAVGYLQNPDVMEWIKRCTSGVALIQIRAFATLSPSDMADQETAERMIARFDFLSAPIVGLTSSRATAMRARNERELDLLRRLYGPGMLDTVVFEPTTSEGATMTWTLPDAEFKQLKTDLETERNIAAVRKLEAIWTRRKPFTP